MRCARRLARNSGESGEPAAQRRPFETPPAISVRWCLTFLHCRLKLRVEALRRGLDSVMLFRLIVAVALVIAGSPPAAVVGVAEFAWSPSASAVPDAPTPAAAT